MSDDKLLPCPFCGGEVELHHDTSSDYERNWTYTIRCPNQDCGCDFGHYKTITQVVQKWNKRTPVYSHRNGETEAPTVDGVYWFKGKCYHNGGIPGDSCTTISDSGRMLFKKSNDWLVKYGIYCWICGNRVTVDGQWWGPVLAPWERQK